MTALDPATVSRLLFESREIASMFGDVIMASTGKADPWCARLVRQIDEFRAAQGWSPHGYGFGSGDEPAEHLTGSRPDVEPA